MPVVFVRGALDSSNGKFNHANSFLPDTDQTKAEKEELIWPKS